MDALFVKVEFKSVCGVCRAYPVCHKARLFAALARSKTLQDADLKIIQDLGYIIEEVVPACPLCGVFAGGYHTEECAFSGVVESPK